MRFRRWVQTNAGGIWKIEAVGVRTTLAVAVPLFIGQVFGRDDLGLLIGLGGLNVCTADKFGADFRALLITVFCVAFAGLCGSVIAPHMYLAIFAIFLWALGCGLLGAYGDLAGNIGFTTTIVFSIALGLPPLTHFVGDLSRTACIGLGGLWAAVLSAALWKITGKRSAAQPPGPKPIRGESVFERLAANLTPKSKVFRHSLRIAVATLVAVAVYKGFHIEHGYWLVLTVIVIVKPDFAATRLRAGERILGSVIGGLAGVVVVALVHDKRALDLLLVVFCVIAYSHAQDNYGLFVTFLTPFVVLLINIAAPGNWQIALVRIVNTVIGCALALTVAYLLRPREKLTTGDVG